MERCDNSHKKELLNSIRNYAAENCFLYGDIENFSLESDFMDVWKSDNNEITTSILLRYYKYYVVYSTNNDDLPAIAKIINKDNNYQGISGLEKTMESLRSHINFSKIKNMYLAELSSKSYKKYDPVVTPKTAVKQDINDLFSFQSSIDEFNLTEESRESFGQEVINGTGRIYFIKKSNRIVSTAVLTAENSLNGMIIGVATSQNNRRKGLAKSCVGTLCKEMVEKGKSVLLFYDNPDAGRLYKELGFVDINRWTMGVK